MRRDAGLTLIELLVVVFLLGLLAQAAVLASAGALEEAQQQTTQQNLAQLEIALLGQPQRLDSLGRPNYGGFVADIGGLPVHRGAPASATPEEALAVALRELWMQPGAPVVGQPPALDPDGLRSLAAFTLQTSSLDPDVRLACGWRGPYLRLAAGAAALRDGWGNSYRLFDRDGVASVLGGEIAAVLSYGADAAAAGNGYAADLSSVLEATGTALSPSPIPARHRGDVPVRVQTSASGGDVLVVRVYGPVAGTLAVMLQEVRSPSGTPFPPGLPVDLTLAGVTIGPRVLRAYQTTALPADTDSVPPGPRSAVLPITVEPFAIQPLQLTIQGS